MKKTVSLLLAFVIAIGILTIAPVQFTPFSVVAGAEETTAPETTTPEVTEPETTPPAESFLTYELNADKKSYSVTGYTGTPINVVIPTEYEGMPVTEIRSGAFRYCTALKTITIPDTIIKIGQDAFSNCTSLVSVALPQKITEIEPRLFTDCTSLQEVIIQNGTKIINSYAFANCTNLNKVILPDSVEKISGTAFLDTYLYKNTKDWENGALYINNHLIRVNKTIGESYHIKQGTVSIAEFALSNLPFFISLYLPKSIKAINHQEFLSIGLKYICYEGNQENFNKIDFSDNKSYINKITVVYNADGVNVPSQPKLTSVSNVAEGVKITWSAVKNADSYIVWRRGTGETKWSVVATTDKTTATDFYPTYHRTYYRYSVQAINKNGISDFDYTGKFLKYIVTPDLLGISNATNGIYIKWAHVEAASGYRIYRRGAGEKYWTYLCTVKNPGYSIYGMGYTDTGVKNANGKYYRYTVRAVVDGIYSGYEDFMYIKRLANPTLKSATSGNGGITVKWSAIKGTTGYYVYRKTANSNWVRIGAVGGTNNTTFLDKTAKTGTTYTYTVRAVYGKTTSYFDSGIKCKR